MSILQQTALRLVVYEGPGSSPLPDSSRFDIISTLLNQGYSVTRTTGQGTVAPHDRTQIVVLGDFQNNNPPLWEDSTSGHRVRSLDIHGQSPDQIVQHVETERNQAQAVKPGDWKPWFPVIDYDRCTNCMQCLSFCLFGVYGVDTDHRIQVQNNDNCKTNCPACSRVCPEAAIMFPKYKSGPINGDTVSDADLQREKMKVDISSLLGGDVYSLLRQRSERAQSRFSKERDADKALTERQKCLTKLAQSGDIPAEVLMSLPSPEEILRKAEEAKIKAADALRGAAQHASTPTSGPS